MLYRLYNGHKGIEKSRRIAKQSFWLISLSAVIAELTKNCRKRYKMDNATHPEPLKLITLPLRPWQRAATCLMHLNQTNYLIIVDCYARFIVLIDAQSLGFSILHKITNMQLLIAPC